MKPQTGVIRMPMPYYDADTQEGQMISKETITTLWQDWSNARDKFGYDSAEEKGAASNYLRAIERRYDEKSAMKLEFRPGVYRHWKGPLYRALFLAHDSTNQLDVNEEPVVVYLSLEHGSIHVRSLEQWSEQVPNPGYNSDKLGQPTVPRFEYVKP